MTALLRRRVCLDHCYWFCSVHAGTARIFRSGMKTGTIIPLIPPRIKFRPISGCFSHSGQFWPKYIFWPVPDFGLKKKKKKILPPSSSSSSGFQSLLLLVFFFFFLLFSFSSYGFQTHLLLFFLLVGFGPANLLFIFYLCAVQVNDNVFWLFVSLLYSSFKCYVLCFKSFVCFASPRDTLLWVPSCHLCFKIWIFSLLCFLSPIRLTIKILNRMSNLNPLPLFHLLILSINISF